MHLIRGVPRRVHPCESCVVINGTKGIRLWKWQIIKLASLKQFRFAKWLRPTGAINLYERCFEEQLLELVFQCYADPQHDFQVRFWFFNNSRGANLSKAYWSIPTKNATKWAFEMLLKCKATKWRQTEAHRRYRSLHKKMLNVENVVIRENMDSDRTFYYYPFDELSVRTSIPTLICNFTADLTIGNERPTLLVPKILTQNTSWLMQVGIPLLTFL